MTKRARMTDFKFDAASLMNMTAFSQNIANANMTVVDGAMINPVAPAKEAFGRSSSLPVL